MKKFLKSSYPLIFLGLLLASSIGCVTTQQGEYMEIQIKELQEKQKTLSNSISANQQEYEAMLKQARSDVEQIRNVLNDATKLMQRNSADFGAEFERYQQDFAALRGKVETLAFNLDKIQKDFSLFKEDVDLRFSNVQTSVSAAPSNSFAAAPIGGGPPKTISGNTSTTTTIEVTPDRKVGDYDDVSVVANPKIGDDGRISVGMDPGAMLTTADNFRNQGKLHKAQEMYTAVIQTYPDETDILPRAIYGLGATLLQLKDAKGAGKQFEQILSNYKDSEYLDDAYYGLGDVFVELGSCRNAAKFYNRIIQRFKDSPLVSKAQGRLKLIDNKQLCKDK